jgi:hypothetical protein
MPAAAARIASETAISLEAVFMGDSVMLKGKFPAGMTNKAEQATARANADSLRE